VPSEWAKSSPAIFHLHCLEHPYFTSNRSDLKLLHESAGSTTLLQKGFASCKQRTPNTCGSTFV
jgi:hypothetical protein